MQRIQLLILTALTLLLGQVAAQADLLFTINPPVRSGTPGSTVTFAGTLQNTGSNELFLNGTSFTLAGAGLTLDDSKFFNNAPPSLLGGASWMGDIFDVMIDASAALGDYPGSFSILGGGDGMAQDLLATAGFQVNVTPAAPPPQTEGSIFLTGHDPDFHVYDGALNPTGSRNIIRAAINYVMDPAFNPFVVSGVNKFLFVESKIAPPSGHVNGVNGIIASGYRLGIDFDHHDVTTLNTALDSLGTTYSTIVVASDHGGVLTQAELDILNARSSDIINFLNHGGGLYAMAESTSHDHLTPRGGHFGFLPFVVSSTRFDQSESGITVTPFGASLSLTNFDVNGNVSHNIFTGTFGLQVVDFDRFGNILSLAGRGKVGGGGVNPAIPEPTIVTLLVIGLASLVVAQWWRKRDENLQSSAPVASRG